ncbi:MAG: ABC transporter ATP-binding protein [Nitriliruptor sp.]|nr:MAG: ABC transporter ATP-binding protein [Nitriliruptor sp.]TVR24212.1 MAG: ABC transporter ATP-binding protein [Nitriliruptor sp.]
MSASSAGTDDPSLAAETVELTKVYGEAQAEVRAVDGVTLTVPTGSYTAVMGPSGSGKSTLLHCLAGLDRPTSGTVRIGGTDLAALKDKQLTELRRERVGFVFQAFNLVPTLTARENIVLPLRLGRRDPDPDWFDAVITSLALGDRLAHKPAELSGGQQQRVAVARALVTRPQLVFGDEPTGNLDRTSGQELLALLRRSVDELGQTIVMVTHDPIAAATADRVWFLADGRVVDELAGPTVDDVLDRIRALES